MSDLRYCIDALVAANGGENFASGLPEEKQLRALMNVTMPTSLSEEYYLRQDRVLRGLLAKKHITKAEEIPEIGRKIALWRGDITTLEADAVVNACNSRLLGCFAPLHACIDNAIHSFAGLEVRRDLMPVMAAQGGEEPNGRVKVTAAYNLPSKYIFHTVGPIYSGVPRDVLDLSSCYRSCLKKAEEMKLRTIAFCSISTGVFGFPILRASEIAVRTVLSELSENSSIKKVIFNVFSEEDERVYEQTIERFI